MTTAGLLLLLLMAGQLRGKRMDGGVIVIAMGGGRCPGRASDWFGRGGSVDDGRGCLDGLQGLLGRVCGGGGGERMLGGCGRGGRYRSQQ